MLRVSAKITETEIDIQGIAGDSSGAAIGIEFGRELIQFAESLARRDAAALDAARQALFDAAGSSVLVDAAGVAANFQRMVRIADSIGIPVDDMTTEVGQQVRADLNLTAFTSAGNTLERNQAST